VRLLARLELVLAQIAELERERDAVMETEAPDKVSKMIQQLNAVADKIDKDGAQDADAA